MDSLIIQSPERGEIKKIRKKITGSDRFKGNVQMK